MIYGASGEAGIVADPISGGSFATNFETVVVVNSATGTIRQGIDIFSGKAGTYNQTGTVVNYGVISGAAATTATSFGGILDAVYFAFGGSVTNKHGASILPSGSKYGILLAGTAASTVTNAGSIGGGVGTLSVKFASNAAAADRLEIDQGASFGGKVKGGGAASGIILGSSASIGTIAGANLALTAGSQYYNFGGVTVASGAQWSITGTASIGSAYTLTNSGTIFDPGTLNVAHLLGIGTIAFGSGSTIMALSSAAAGSTNKIAGVTAGQTIEVVGATSLLTAANLLSGGIVLALPVFGGGSISLKLASSIASSNFFHVTNSGGNAFITENTTPCFLAGTRIRTDKGEVLVEDLRIGDRVVTLDGTAKPIKWIGRRAYASAFAAGNRDIIPILIKQGALGDNVPERDLYVSPLHAMYLDGVLVQAEHLVNGVSVVRCADIDPIRYFHIELDRHGVVFAEGALAETFVDCDSRGMFHNAHEFAELYADDATAEWKFCAPRVESGPVLARIRDAIDSRAGLAPAGTGTLQGNLDGLDGNSITGWAFEPARPDVPVTLEVLDGDGVIARVVANRFRADLEAAGIGDGRHGFDLKLARPLSPSVQHTLRVRRVGDGRELLGSPLLVEPHDRRALVRDTADAIAQAADAAGDPVALDALMDTLLESADRVRRLHAAAHVAGGAKRALVVGAYLPRRGRSDALLAHIEALRSLGWAVEYVASAELSFGDDAMHLLRAMGVTCHRAPQVASVEEVLRRQKGHFDLVYLFGAPVAIAYAGLARAWQERARVVFGAETLDDDAEGVARYVDATIATVPTTPGQAGADAVMAAVAAAVGAGLARAA